MNNNGKTRMLREVRQFGYEDGSWMVDLHYPIFRVNSLFKGRHNVKCCMRELG